MNFISTSRLRKMKKLFRAREYAAAVEYAAKLNPQEITTAYDLSMMADVYVINKDLESAKVIYQELYKRNKSSRNLKTLIDASIKCGDIEGAVVSLRELIAMDDTDIDIYIFQYRIGKITNQSDDYLIKCLQKVRELDYIDVWALALAKLYFKAGLNEECLKECKNIKLWFPETDFEHKAQLLEDAVSSGASYEDLFGNAPSEDMMQEDVPHDADGYIPLEESGYENDGEDASAEFAEGDEEPLPEIEFEDEEIPHVTLGDETLAAGGYDGTDYYDDDDDDDCDEFGNVIVKEPEEEKDDDEIDGQLSFNFDLEEEEEPVEEELPEEEPEDTKEYFDEDDYDDDDDDDDCDEFGNVIIRKPEPVCEDIPEEASDEEEEEIAEELFDEEEDDEEIEGGSIPDEYYDYDDDDDDDDCDEYGNVIIREPEEDDEDEFTFDDEFSDELLKAVTREENGEASGEEVDESINRMLRGNKK